MIERQSQVDQPKHPLVYLTLDCCEGFTAPVRKGKTVKMVGELIPLLPYGHVLFHDRNCNAPDVLPSGQEVPLDKCVTVTAAAKLIAKYPERRVIYVINRDSPDDCFDFCAAQCDPVSDPPRRSIYEQVTLAGKVQRVGVPYFCAIDEAGNWSSVAASPLDRAQFVKILEIVTQRRHYHMGLYWGTQNPRQINWQMIANSSMMHIGRFSGSLPLNRLKEGGIHERYVTAIAEQPGEYPFLSIVPNSEPDDRLLVFEGKKQRSLF